jgi:uncharacterized radical SAM superfamily Fe-S cluster-containing enzyme
VTAGPVEECFQATRALCNLCGRLTDAKIVFAGQTVRLVKWCPDHGETRALVSSSRDWYLKSLAYVKPMTAPLTRSSTAQAPCPEACGLCARHQQHSCVPLLEITPACDLACPDCLTAGRVPAPLTLEEVDRVVDRLLACEGKLNMLTLTGGEPTMHPRFLDVVDAVLRPEIGIVSVSTNGVRLAREAPLVKALADRGVVVALQLDGHSPATSERLRGRGELAAVKRRLVDDVLAAGGRVSLTLTLARGVNEGELGSALELLFANDGVMSLMVQPLAALGPAAAPARDALDGITIPEVIERLAAASGGVLRAADFTPLPCSHPTCFALTYLLKTAPGQLVSLPSILDVGPYLDIIKNQALLGTDRETLFSVRDALYALWSSDGVVPNRDAVLGTVKRILRDLEAVGAAAPPSKLLALGARHVKSIFIHQFMDRTTFDLGRAAKCCNHYPQADGRLLPACVRNVGLAPAATGSAPPNLSQVS